MTSPPPYFDEISTREASRWQQLEHDPGLAGPWHQLFMQIQSPRHVLSELLQNADDAGATVASVRIEGGEFWFSHNGEDFTPTHFSSLCSFGYSKKRSLHTIGFRGIGFKSIFSLGNTIRLQTPTLSVEFHRLRFTYPVWVPGKAVDGLTSIRVQIKNRNLETELAKNLIDWTRSPISLLFFRNIRNLRINGSLIHWSPLETGPVKNSTWMILENTGTRYLLIHSDPEPFPEEAIAEINQERMVNADDMEPFPPSQVEIVFGAEGRLFVILPTGVRTRLPFAANAPFLQDPARVKLKDPETSPTNRWLLKRIGVLAGTILLEWLRRADLEPEDKVAAYGILPLKDPLDNSIEGVAELIVTNAIEEILDRQRFVLTEDGQLVGKGEAIVLPEPIHDVWTPDQASLLFDSAIRRSVLSKSIRTSDKSKLVRWADLKSVTRSNVVEVLEVIHTPKPETFYKLLDLWLFLAPEITGFQVLRQRKTLKILPSQGDNLLYAEHELSRVSDLFILESLEDCQFLSKYIKILDPAWTRFVYGQQNTVTNGDRPDTKLYERVNAAYGIFQALGILQPPDVNKLIRTVALDVFRGNLDTKEAVRLTQIACTLDAEIGAEFCFITVDNKLKKATSSVIFDEYGRVESSSTQSWAQAHILDAAYTKEWISCTKQQWHDWVFSGRSGLFPFFPLQATIFEFYGQERLRNFLETRGSSQTSPILPYRRPQFRVHDFDFDAELWKHWDVLAVDDPLLWVSLLSWILNQPVVFWNEKLTSTVRQSSSSKNDRQIEVGLLPAGWLFKLRSRRCLQDTHGIPQLPSHLMLRTPETEALLDVEPFVEKKIDSELNRSVLTLLGVRDKPTGPRSIMERLIALSRAPVPPLLEVMKWYQKLDQIMLNAPQHVIEEIGEEFRLNNLIFTEGGWVNSKEVFAVNDEGIPGILTLNESVMSLSLWQKVGVAHRPSLERVIIWLRDLPKNIPLPAQQIQRIRSVLALYPHNAWNSIGCWLNLSGEWVPTENLQYSLTMQSLTPWKNLFEHIKRVTSDFQMLPTEVLGSEPFLHLPTLAGVIKEGLEQSIIPVQEEDKNWLKHLGNAISRIVFEDKGGIYQARNLGVRLAKTKWRVVSGLESVPLIDGKPAGPAHRVNALWAGETLWVENIPLACVAAAVSYEIGRAFQYPAISDAVKLCFERDEVFIENYMKENFDLEAQVLEFGIEKAPKAPMLPLVQSSTPQPTTSSYDTEIQETVSSAQPLGEMSEGKTQKSHVSRTRLMERFALSLGYKKVDDNQFVHDDRTSILRIAMEIFPWQKRTPGGETIRFYYPREHCLWSKPLELEVSIWNLCEKFPDLYSLILNDEAGKPLEVNGRELMKEYSLGKLKLFPATYRLVHHSESG